MRKLIYLAVFFQLVTATLVSLLIFVAPAAINTQADLAGQIPNNQSASPQRSLTEDVLRTQLRMDAAMQKVRWSSLTMIAISLLFQFVYLIGTRQAPADSRDFGRTSPGSSSNA